LTGRDTPKPFHTATEVEIMPRRRISAILPFLGCAAAFVLSTPGSGHAETVKPDQIAYDANVREDPATKACTLDLAMNGNAVRETVRFQLVVARMKRNAALAGPAMFGFTIEVQDTRSAPKRKSELRPIEISSAAFSSDRYTAAARPRTAPFPDRSWVASTLDSVQGGELVDATAAGKFQIVYTRTRPSASRTYEVSSTPPSDVLSQFSGCVDGLQTIE
jgi:hypothetical protein